MRLALVLLPIVALSTLASAAHAAGADGGAVWAQHCQACHGASGAGDSPAGKAMHVASLKDPKWASADALAKIESAVRNGVGKMPPMASALSADQITAVAQYLQQLAGAK